MAAPATDQPPGEPTVTPSAPTTSPEPPAAPTVDPTVDPTAGPTVDPTIAPTVPPSAEPTVEPSGVPTAEPTGVPTAVPTVEPTTGPTDPTRPDPSGGPTALPTELPTALPTDLPTQLPTKLPTKVPGLGGAGEPISVDIGTGPVGDVVDGVKSGDGALDVSTGGLFLGDASGAVDPGAGSDSKSAAVGGSTASGDGNGRGTAGDDPTQIGRIAGGTGGLNLGEVTGSGEKRYVAPGQDGAASDRLEPTSLAVGETGTRSVAGLRLFVGLCLTLIVVTSAMMVLRPQWAEDRRRQ